MEMTFLSYVEQLTVFKPAMAAGPVLLVVGLVALILLIKGNLCEMSSMPDMVTADKKDDKSLEEGLISLGLRRAVNEFMRN